MYLKCSILSNILLATKDIIYKEWFSDFGPCYTHHLKVSNQRVVDTYDKGYLGRINYNLPFSNDYSPHFVLSVLSYLFVIIISYDYGLFINVNTERIILFFLLLL